MFNGARAIKKQPKNDAGSVTVEACLVLPVFLIVILSLAYFIKIFYTYNMVQASLSEVARRIGNFSYFYYVSGLKDYSDALSLQAEQAGNELEKQKNTVLDAVGSFNDTFTGMGQAFSTGELDSIQQVIDGMDSMGENTKEVEALVQSIIADPKAELRLLMTVLAQKLSYEATKGLVCLIAKGDLGAELDKRVLGDGDGASLLGIKGGKKGLDFTQSNVFGDRETLEFVVHYSVDVPLVFDLLPDIQLSNKVKIVAWTSGRGSSVRKAKETTSSSSIWVDMDQDQRYWDRGLEIEDIHVDKIVKERTENQMTAVATSKNYPVIDAYAYNTTSGVLEYYDVFTLNPFLKTYTSNPKAIGYEIKKHARRLLDCEAPDELAGMSFKEVKRKVIIIVPENAQLDEKVINEVKADLAEYGVEFELLKLYGQYTPPVEADGQGDTEEGQQETNRQEELPLAS